MAGEKERTVLFVCTGNTCRSPMAAGYFNALCRRAGVSGLRAESAGVAARDGSSASPHAVAAGAARGFDLRGHASRRLTPALAEAASAIYGLTRGHVQAVRAIAPGCAPRVRALREAAGLPGEVDDPFGGGQPEYDACLDGIVEAVDVIFRRHASDVGGG